jgi:hypothetical protein
MTDAADGVTVPPPVPQGAGAPGDAPAGATASPTVRDARRVWIIGGSLLVAHAAIVLILGAYPIPVTGAAIVLDVIWAAALILFAFGFRRAGSVVARQPLGIVALLVAGLQPLFAAAAWRIVPTAVDSFDAQLNLMLGQGLAVVMLVALVTAAVVIGRAGGVPHGIRWVPLIVVAVGVGAEVLTQAVIASSVGNVVRLDITALIFGTHILQELGVLLLGILAIVFAPRERPRPAPPTQVYPPAF